MAKTNCQNFSNQLFLRARRANTISMALTPCHQIYRFLKPGLALDVFLALLPLRVARKAQLVEHGLHRYILNCRAVFEQAVAMFPGIGDIA